MYIPISFSFFSTHAFRTYLFFFFGKRKGAIIYALTHKCKFVHTPMYVHTISFSFFRTYAFRTYLFFFFCEEQRCYYIYIYPFLFFVHTPSVHIFLFLCEKDGLYHICIHTKIQIRTYTPMYVHTYIYRYLKETCFTRVCVHMCVCALTYKYLQISKRNLS